MLLKFNRKSHRNKDRQSIQTEKTYWSANGINGKNKKST